MSYILNDTKRSPDKLIVRASATYRLAASNYFNVRFIPFESIAVACSA